MALVDISRTSLLCSIAAGSFAFLAIGCASPRPATLQQLHHRSVFDLGCASHQLKLHHIDQRTKVVTGCGRRLIYVHTCEGQGPKRGVCTWKLDTPTFAHAQWPQHHVAGGQTQPVVHLTPSVQCPGGQSQPVVVRIEQATPSRRVATELFPGGQPTASATDADPRIRTELFPSAGSGQPANPVPRTYRTKLFDPPKPPPPRKVADPGF